MARDRAVVEHHQNGARRLRLVLVAGGRLELDRPLAGRRFTLRQLLQHASGLGCYTEHAGL